MPREQFAPNSILRQLVGGKQYGVRDSYIAVMGVTGSGKSTFISRCVGGGARIGHDLVSCTSEIECFTFQFNNQNVHLIDTPGFHDTYRTDSDVLKDIAFWLNTSYQKDIRLSGIVYLHPIDRNRITGAAFKNLRMFHKLCGNESLPSVILGTTMWKNVDGADGEARMEQLKMRPDFWGDMIAQGSRVFRHEDSRVSALNIVTYILDQRRTTVLEIQRQMVDEGRSLDETAAGQEVEKELLRQRALFERRLKEAQEEMQVALEEGNRRNIEDAMGQQERFQKKLEEAMSGSRELNITMEKLLEEKDKEYREAMAQLETEKKRRESESRLTRQQIEDLRVSMKAREDAAEEQRRKHYREMDEINLNMSKQALESQVKFQQYLGDQTRLQVSSDINTGDLSVPQGSSPARSPSPSVDEAFACAAATSAGTAVGAAAVAAMCILM